MATRYASEREAALSLLRSGLATVPEVARLAGVSVQLVRHWAKQAGIDWTAVREQRLAVAWSKAVDGGKARRVKETKR